MDLDESKIDDCLKSDFKDTPNESESRESTSDESSNNEDETDSDSFQPNDDSSLMPNDSFDYYYDDHINSQNKDWRIKQIFNQSKSISNHEVCVILENHSRMSEDFLIILSDHHLISTWPTRLDFAFNHATNPKLSEIFKDCYHSLIHKKIECSKVIVAFVTNKFIQSTECTKLIGYSKELRKPLIAVIVDEIDDYEEIKKTILKDFTYYCEIYTERVNQFGYDYFLWISKCFDKLLAKFSDLLERQLVINNFYSII
jgi:hypothetical protein